MYKFHDPCQKKCKVTINQALIYYLNFIFFNDYYEHIIWIYIIDIEKHMFKIYLNKILKNINN
jgi:hypothetical protein